MDIRLCQLLNNYSSKKITKEYLMKQGVSLDEVHQLIEIGALKPLAVRDIYMIHRGVVQAQIVCSALDKDEVLSRKSLMAQGIDDSTIRKMVGDGKLFVVKRGFYSKEPVQITKEVSNIHLTIPERMMASIEHSDLASALQILEETNGEEWIQLSKSLWKWVLTQTLSIQVENKQNSISRHEEKEVSEKEDACLNDEIEVRRDPSFDQMDSFVVAEVGEDVNVQTENTVLSIEEDRNSNEVEKSEDSSSNLVQSVSTKSMTYIPTGLPINELFSLYRENLSKDPLLAREFLLEYMDRCKEENILFDSKELSIANTFVCGMGISREQLREEKKLRYQINALINTNSTPYVLEKLQNVLDQFYELYQDRGILSTIYRGCYEAKIGNYKEAITFYNKVLEDEPWNAFTLNQLFKSHIALKQLVSASEVMRRNLDYNPFDSWGRLHLAICYASRNMIPKIREITDSCFYKNSSEFQYYLKKIITLILDRIEIEKECLARQSGNHGSICKRIDLLYRELEYYQDLYSQQLSADIGEEMVTGESILSSYEDEVYCTMFDEVSEVTCLSGVESYVKNLEISKEEEMLLYIAAAKIMFLHKWPKQGEHYLKLVAMSHVTDPVVQQEYKQCIRNKILYLNK